MADDAGEVPAIRVSGGAGGIQARFDDIERLGRLYRTTGDRLVQWAWDDKLEAADGDLLASAVLSPATFAQAEAAILDATYGPDGLVPSATLIQAQSLCFEAVVEIYRGADELRQSALETVSYGLGYVVGVHLPTLVVAGGLAYGGLHLVDPELAGLAGDDLVDYLEDHPAVVEGLVNGGGGLLDGMAVNPLTGPVMAVLGLGSFHPDTGAAADDLGELLFGDYEGELDDSYPLDEFRQLDAPNDVRDLIDDLAETADKDVADGVINIQRIEGPDGSVRHIVQLPGTDDFLDEHAIRNMGSNLNLIAGDDTAYGDAVGQAMAAAGVGTHDPVMLVGHSQGGMQAAALAADPDFGYDVTHVVTAGSPVATSGIPDDVTVLSLENTGDVVPLLDGEANPTSAHHVTVQADVHTGSLGADDGQNHSLETYGQIADAVDRSDHASVQHAVASMQGFLGGEVSTSTSFQTRQGDQVRPPDLPIGTLIP